MDLVHRGGRSSMSDYDDSPRSPRSSRRSRKNSQPIPPHAPDVPGDEEPASPPRRRMIRERSGYRDRDGDWDRRQEDEILLRTPESRASSSSHHPSRPRYHGSDSRRDQSTTPSRSVASSMTSVATHQPPRSSLTRQSQALYRRPSVSMREPLSLEYDDELVHHETRRSRAQSRSICVVPIVSMPPQSRRTSRSRVLSYASSSSSESEDDDTEEGYDSQDDHIRSRSNRDTQLVRISRDERSRSRADTSRRSDHQSRRREISVGRDMDDHDEMDDRDYPSPDERPRKRILSRQPSRAPSHAPSRPQSRPASVRRITIRGNDHAFDHDRDHRHDDGHDDDTDLEERPALDHRDQITRKESHKDRHRSRTSREHRRNRSESHSKRSPPSRRSSPKRYYESEGRTVEKRDKYHPPSASHRRSKTTSVSGSVAASQHQSVSSTKRPSILGSFFSSPHYGPSQHHAPPKAVKLYECVVCMDDLPARKIVKLKCGHRMCNACLKRSFKLSITDPQHMPPKCCTADFIPLKHVDQLFDKAFKKNWNKKFVEYSARNRVYCIKRGCAEFIRPQDIRRTSDGKKVGQCPKCSTKVCVQCGGKFHKGRDCPKDEETAKFLAQAKDEGWQRCLKCKAIIELEEGCNHMTCRCGAEFCYVCGTKWKSCECPWFNYDAVEADRLHHMEERMQERMQEPHYAARPTVDLPLESHREGRPGETRLRPQTYEEEMRFRRIQQDQDEQFARHLQGYREDERDGDFREGFGDITALGNAAGHFMNEDFRLRPRNISVPQPPPPHAPAVPLDPSAMFDRTAAGDYVHGVNRARGVRANSMTRLADRFTARPPPPLATATTMPLPAALGLAPGPQIRRHTVEAIEIGSRTVERPSGRVVRPVVYDEPEEMMTPAAVGAHAGKAVPVVRKQHVREPAKGPVLSALAGLTEGGSYSNRVHEWRKYVGGGGMMEPPPQIAS